MTLSTADGLALVRVHGPAERWLAVLVAPERFTANPPGTEHQEPA